MPQKLIYRANIAPSTAPMEVSYDGGTTFVALAFATVGSLQEATLANVPAATYAIGKIVMRAVGYPATTVSNAAALTVLAAATSRTIEAVGDSILFGQYTAPLSLSAPINSWYAQMQRLINNTAYTCKAADAYPGRTAAWYVTNHLPDLLSRIQALADPTSCIVMEFFGANDLTEAGATAQSVYTSRKQIWTAVRNAGAKVLVGTNPNRADPYGSANFAADRLSLAALIRSGAGADHDGVIDFAAQAQMGTDAAPQDTELFGDKAHPTAYGDSLLAPVAAQKLIAFTGLAAGPAPATTILRQPVPAGYAAVTLQQLAAHITQAGTTITRTAGGTNGYTEGGAGTFGGNGTPGNSVKVSVFCNINRSKGGVLVGWANDNTSIGLSDTDYGIRLDAAGYEVLEAGASLDLLAQAANSRDYIPVQMDIWDNRVEYFVNNTQRHVSYLAPAFPLAQTVRLFAAGAEITDLSFAAAAPVAFPFAPAPPVGEQLLSWTPGAANTAYTAGSHTVSRTGGGAWDAGALATLAIGNIAAATGYLGTYTMPDMPRATGGVVTGLTVSPTTLADVGYTGISAGVYWDNVGGGGFFGAGNSLGSVDAGNATTLGKGQVVVNKDADGIRFDFLLDNVLKATRKIPYSAALFPIVPDCSLNLASSQVVGATLEGPNLVASGF